MTLFALEALEARSGDALIVHFGTDADPRLMLVDGGFATTYTDVLKPRLDAIRVVLDPNFDHPLPLDVVVVSHIDNDHINGIVRLCRDLKDAADIGNPPPYAIGRLWHNAFNDSLDQLTAVVASPETVTAQAEAGTAGVSAGRELRDLGRRLNRDGNPPFNGFVIGPREVDLGNGLTGTFVGPSLETLDELRRKWAEVVVPRINRGEIAEAAAYVDDSAANLSSIVIHLRQGNLSMLLTGDGRGDHTLAGLRSANLLNNGGPPLRVDILKLPHHGSFRNIERDYFENIIASHYVASANGKDDNPSVDTLRLLVETQGDRRYMIHLTNPVRHALDFLAADQAAGSRNYVINVRRDGDPSVLVPLVGNPP